MYILKRKQNTCQQTDPAATWADSHLGMNCSSCLFIRETKIVAKFSNLGSTTVFLQFQEYSVPKCAVIRMIYTKACSWIVMQSQ